jgi:hypothetical protein
MAITQIGSTSQLTSALSVTKCKRFRLFTQQNEPNKNLDRHIYVVFIRIKPNCSSFKSSIGWQI